MRKKAFLCLVFSALLIWGALLPALAAGPKGIGSNFKKRVLLQRSQPPDQPL